MTTYQEYLESQPNFIATFENICKKGENWCLMSDNKDGRYWQRPTYYGAIASGATIPFDISLFQYAKEKGLLRRISKPTWAQNNAGRFIGTLCPVCAQPLRLVLDGESWCDYCLTYY